VKGRVGLLGWLLRLLAVSYPIALIAIVLALRFVGERWWVTTVALYVPRLGFVLPLPFLTLALVIWGPRRLLVSQAVAALVWLFPLMGYELPGAASPTPGAFHLRVVTCNIATGLYGNDAILAMLHATDADVIMLQETTPAEYAILPPGLPGYSVRISGQFLLASRFPVEEVVEPPKIPHYGLARSPRFVRYRVSTPAGVLRIYNVHPISPRDGLEELRGEGLRREIVGGHIFQGGAAATVTKNATLRLAQLQAIADDARQSTEPVIIAGDTNLPTRSWALAHFFGDLRDGFSDAGSGLGYTYPVPRRRPWMRIDRVLADQHFRFVHFEVIRTRASDHLAVMADLELLPSTSSVAR
jgi:endonuclease/exonuclease/phosphatase (EEP) superfamily protein YafD